MNIKMRDTVCTLTNDKANQSWSIRKRQNTYSASNYFEKMKPILEQKYRSAWLRNTLSLTYVILLTIIQLQKKCLPKNLRYQICKQINQPVNI